MTPATHQQKAGSHLTGCKFELLGGMDCILKDRFPTVQHLTLNHLALLSAVARPTHYGCYQLKLRMGYTYFSVRVYCLLMSLSYDLLCT